MWIEELSLEAEIKWYSVEKYYFHVCNGFLSLCRFDKMGQNSRKDLAALKNAYKHGDPVPRFHYETRTFTLVQLVSFSFSISASVIEINWSCSFVSICFTYAFLYNHQKQSNDADKLTLGMTFFAALWEPHAFKILKLRAEFLHTHRPHTHANVKPINIQLMIFVHRSCTDLGDNSLEIQVIRGINFVLPSGKPFTNVD